MERLRTHLLGLGLVIALFLGSLACSHAPVGPSPLPAEVRQQLGVLGFTYQGPASLTVGAKPVRGAGDGARTGALVALAGTVQAGSGCSDPRAAAGLLVLSPGIIAAGALLGAVLAPSAAAVEEAEATLDQVATDPDLPAAIRDRLVQMVEREAPSVVRLLPDPDPMEKDERLAQAAWAREGIHTVLEVKGPLITLTKSGFAGPINPALRLSVSLSTRVIRTADGEVLYSSFSEHHGEARTFTEWAANDAQPLREALDRATDALSPQVVTRLLGLTAP